MGDVFDGPRPGGHEIFDFLKRDPANRIPTFAVAEEKSVPFLLGKSNPAAFAAAALALFLVPALLLLARRRRVAGAILAVLGVAAGVGAFLAVRAWLPATRPWVENNRRGPVFWAEAGARPATVIRMPVTFPPEAFPDGRMLSGLGVPDISGRIGRPAYFTSDPFFMPREGNDFSVEIVRLESNVGRQKVRVLGPPGRAFGREGTIDASLTLSVPDARDRIVVEAEGARAELSVGQWSDWIPLVFRVNPLVAIRGYARMRLTSVQPEIGLYLSPIQFDPQHLPPGFTISAPRGFAEELVREYGRYKTMGWAIDTWSIQSGTLPEDAFLEDVKMTADQERRMLRGLLARKDRLLFHYFEFPDRVGHVFWRFRDPEHPAYDAKLAARYGGAVEDSYAAMDEIVGETAKALSPQDVLPRALGPRVRDVAALGQLQLVAGRERVPRPERKREAAEPRGALLARTVLGGRGLDAIEGLRDGAGRHLRQPRRSRGGRHRRARRRVRGAAEAELIQRLTALADPKNGRKAVSRVFKREEVYRRFDPRLIPDLIAANLPGYRVSWQSSLGVPTDSVFEDNRDVWSGDHCSLDPALVRGVFFSSKAFRAEPTPGIADVTASVRALVGGGPVDDAAGTALW